MFCRGIEQNDTPVIRIVGHFTLRPTGFRASDRQPLPWDYFLLTGNPSRTDAKRGDRFLRANLPGVGGVPDVAVIKHNLKRPFLER
jgi:hypothetical protein